MTGGAENDIDVGYARLFAHDVWAIRRGQFVLMGLLSIAAPLVEGLSLTMLFPLLSLLGFGGGGQIDAATRYLQEFLAQYGIAITLTNVLIALVAMVILQNLFFLLQSWNAAGLQVEFVAQWRRKLFDVYLRARWDYIAQKNAGILAHMSILETERASNLIGFGSQILVTFFTCTAYLTVAALTSWKIAGILVIFGILIVGITHRVIRNPVETAEQSAHDSAIFASIANESLLGMKLIRAVSGEPQVQKNVNGLVGGIAALNRRLLMHPAYVRASFEISAVAALAVTLAVGAELLGESGVVVFLIVALFIRLYPRVSSLQQYANAFRLHIPFYKSIQRTYSEALAAREILASGSITLNSSAPPPEIVLDRLSVHYGNRPALRDVSLTIPGSRMVAIVGVSGAGKSTLVDALLRLVPGTGGNILVEGTPLAQIDLASWRRSVGYVAQDTFLFNASIRDNIAFGNPDASQEEIRDAARQAQIAEFIEALPDGYGTLVGDRGVRLSGGQRQRVGLARALIGQRKILILDEATSSLDSETERGIMESIEHLHGKVTIIIIAHRLSTLKSVDLIHVLENGALVESGSWDALIAKGGIFRRHWDMQSVQPESGQCAAGVLPDMQADT